MSNASKRDSTVQVMRQDSKRPDKEEGPVAIAYTPKRFFEAGTAVLRARTNGPKRGN